MTVCTVLQGVVSWPLGMMLRFYTKANSLGCMWCNWLKTSPTGTTCGWVCAVYSVFVTSCVLKDLCLVRYSEAVTDISLQCGNTIWLFRCAMATAQFVEWILGQGSSSDEACIAIMKLNQVTVWSEWVYSSYLSRLPKWQQCQSNYT